MGHTHNTPNFGLPQFIGTDKPSWLEDFNLSMQTIDTALAQNRAASEGAEQSAAQSSAVADSAKALAESANTLSNQAVSDAGKAKGAQTWDIVAVRDNVTVSYNGFMSILRMSDSFEVGEVTASNLPVNVFNLPVSTSTEKTTLVKGVSAYWDGAQTHIMVDEAGDIYIGYASVL